ncbi:MAG: hypothetical protein LBH26_00385 [Treponema sp.]|nr:hypothetical protein [Treponema sp.]
MSSKFDGNLTGFARKIRVSVQPRRSPPAGILGAEPRREAGEERRPGSRLRGIGYDCQSLAE